MGPDRAFSIYGIIKISEGLIYGPPRIARGKPAVKRTGCFQLSGLPMRLPKPLALMEFAPIGLIKSTASY